jgi:hypothetical protein
LKETFNLKGHSYLLTEVKRQEDDSYILENATEIRKAIDRGESSHPIKGIPNRNIYAAADKYAANVKKDGLENQIAIGVSHKANKFFNDLVRERIFGNAKKILEHGDLLMVIQNWYRNGVQLYNGDHVELLSVDWNLQEQVAGLHFVAVKIKVLFTETETIIEDYAILETILSHLQAAQADTQTKACKRVCLFQRRKNFKIFFPPLLKKLKHPIHKPTRQRR